MRAHALGTSLMEEKTDCLEVFVGRGPRGAEGQVLRLRFTQDFNLALVPRSVQRTER